MNLIQALKALIEGKKIRSQKWHKDCYIHLKNGKVVTEEDCDISISNYNCPWELYHDGTMYLEFAIICLLQGKKVRKVEWDKNQFLYFDPNEGFKTETGSSGARKLYGHGWEFFQDDD